MDAPSTDLPRLHFVQSNRTLLIGDPSTSWREWIGARRDGRDYISLDPSDPLQSPPGRFTLRRGEKTAAWRFYGSLAPLRAPHTLLSALALLAAEAADDAIIQLPDFRSGPLMRQMVSLAAEVAAPRSIFVSKKVEIDGLPVGPEAVELVEAFPDMVKHAQRRAQWIKLLEEGEDHEVELSNVSLEGARLGSGRRVTEASVGALHLEACGSTLLIVSDEHPTDRDLARALDQTHCSRVHFVEPGAYAGLLCSFARQDGEDFGMGVIQEIDFKSGVVRARCAAVAPAPVRILRIGGLQLDMAGNEIAEIRPWQV